MGVGNAVYCELLRIFLRTQIPNPCLLKKQNVTFNYLSMTKAKFGLAPLDRANLHEEKSEIRGRNPSVSFTK